jgi:hypothetical protein
LQLSDVEQFERKSSGWNKPRLNPALSTAEQNLARGVAAAEFARQHQGRNHMASGTASGDEQP